MVVLLLLLDGVMVLTEDVEIDNNDDFAPSSYGYNINTENCMHRSTDGMEEG